MPEIHRRLELHPRLHCGSLHCLADPLGGAERAAPWWRTTAPSQEHQPMLSALCTSSIFL